MDWNEENDVADDKHRLNIDDLDIYSDDATGYCRECGAEQDGVEPDAEEYRCEGCGANAVYGIEQYIIHGWVE